MVVICSYYSTLGLNPILVLPVILILLFRSSIEVAGSSCIVQHGEVSQVWEAGGDSLDKNGEVSDLVFVHPQDL